MKISKLVNKGLKCQVCKTFSQDFSFVSLRVIAFQCNLIAGIPLSCCRILKILLLLHVLQCFVQWIERWLIFILLLQFLLFLFILFPCNTRRKKKQGIEAKRICLKVPLNEIHYFWNSSFPAGIYLLKVNSRNTRARCEICSKLTIKTPERRHWRLSGVFIVNFEHISHLGLVFLLLTLKR